MEFDEEVYITPPGDDEDSDDDLDGDTEVGVKFRVRDKTEEMEHEPT